MNDPQQFKRLLLPALRGLPLILVSVIVAVLLTSRFLHYAVPRYESTALLKLDEKANGVSDNNLFKDFDFFTANSKIITEEQVLQSPVLIEKALRLVDFGTSYYRIGDIRKSELYRQAPFFVQCSLRDSSLLDHRISVQVLDSTRYLMSYNLAMKTVKDSGRFDAPLFLPAGVFVLRLNHALMKAQPGLQLVDNYEVVMHSDEALITQEILPRLDVKPFDKEVPIMRITYSSEVPQKAADFSNALAQAYVRDYVESKTEAASKTVQFIDERLDRIGKELRASEQRLESFRLRNRIVNTRQETETGLRKLSDLQVQLTNLDMQETGLNQLAEAVGNRKDMNTIGPAFESFQDPLFTEMIKNLKSYQQERRELLTRYTRDHEKVKLVEEKIDDVNSYLREAISNARKNIGLRRNELTTAVEEADHAFDDLPTKEKNMVNLERDFQLNQKVYQFLLEKRTEASIAEAATISFHRVIQNAPVPASPVFPRRGFLIALAAMTGFLASFTFLYARRYFRGVLEDKSTVERLSGIPVAGILHEQNDSRAIGRDFSTLAGQLTLTGALKFPSLVCVTSSLREEGKTYTAAGLAAAFTRSGRRVLLVDLDLRSEVVGESPLGISEVIERGLDPAGLWTQQADGYNLLAAGSRAEDPVALMQRPELPGLFEKLKRQFDLVIVDTPATAYVLDAVPVLKQADLCLYLLRAGQTPVHQVPFAEQLSVTYDLQNVRFILNGMPPVVNYSGDFTGSRFRYGVRLESRFAKLRHYLRAYVS